MEAASVHPLPEPDRRRLRGVTEYGELKDWMPKDAGPEARQMIEGLLGKLAQASGTETRLKNEMEADAVADIESSKVMEVLVYWRDRCPKKPERVKLVGNSPRWNRVRTRLREGWTVEDLQHVVDYCVTDEFLNGSHPKTEGKAYLGCETIFRDSDQVEKRLGQWRDVEEAAFEERLATHMQKHPCAVYEAVVAERQAQQLYEMEPTAFEPTPSEQRQSTEGEAA